MIEANEKRDLNDYSGTKAPGEWRCLGCGRRATLAGTDRPACPCGYAAAMVPLTWRRLAEERGTLLEAAQNRDAVEMLRERDGARAVIAKADATCREAGEKLAMLATECARWRLLAIRAGIGALLLGVLTLWQLLQQLLHAGGR